MIKYFARGLLLTVLALVSTVHAQSNFDFDDKLYRSALKEYVKESDDYIATLRTTRAEIRSWRSIYLNERFEGRLQTLEKSLVQSNKQIISEMEKILKEGGIDSFDDVLLVRMAQLQFERENFSLAQKMKNYEYQLKSFLSGRISQAPILPVPNFKTSIEYCKFLLTKYPRSPLSDKAHYLMAYGLDEMGQGDAAIEIYKRLIRRHPFSSIIDEVKWRVADHFFDARDLNKAAFYYSELSKKKGSLYQYKALYKLGAAFFAGQKYDTAAEYFTELYKQTKSSQDDNRENETLYDEALEYLGIIQSYGIKLNLDSDVITEVTNRLAQAYKRLPNERRARVVYLDFMRREPYSSKVPPFSNEVIQSYLSEAQVDNADNIRDKLVTFLTRDNQWWKANLLNRKDTFIAEDLLEEYLLSSAQSHAQKGFEKKDKLELKVAREQYQRFLRSYPFSALVSRARFEMAQVEYVAGLYDASKESFEFVMNDPAADIYLDEAAYGYLWSVIKKIGYAMDKESNILAKRNREGDLLKPQVLTEQDKLFMSAAQVYISKAPLGSRRQKVLYKIAEIHFQNNNFDLSQKALDMVINDKEHVTLTTAKALRLSAEISNIKGDWENVAQRNSELLSLSFSTDIKGLGDVQVATAGSQALETATKLDVSGKKLDAAKEYERISLALPHAKFSPYASLRAATLFREEGKFKQSIENSSRLNGTGYEAEGLFLKASNLKSLMSFQESAEAFELFYKQHPSHAWSSEALFTTASLRRDLKQYKEAAQLFVKYADIKKVDTVLFEAMDLYLKSKDLKNLLALISRISSTDRDGQIRAKIILAESYWQKNDIKSVIGQCKNIDSMTKKAKELSAHASRARANCRYYGLSTQLKKPEGADKVVSQVQTLEQFNQSDLTAKLYADIAEQYIVENKTESAIENLKKGWVLEKKNPYSDIGKRLYSLLIKYDKTYPANLGFVANWKLAEGNYFEWRSPSTQQMSWGNARSLCEREYFEDCLKEIDQILKLENSDEMLENKLIALVRAGQDAETVEVLKVLGERSSWAMPIRREAVLLGQQNLIPENLRTIEIPDQNQRVEALVARAALLLSTQKYKQALSDLQEAIKENSEYVPSYAVMARLFHETGHYELMREVLQSGVKNTRSRSGLLGLSLYWDTVIGSNKSKQIMDAVDQLDVRGLYGFGLASQIIGDKKSYEATVSLMSHKGIWVEDMKTTIKVLEDQSVFRGDSDKKNAHISLMISSASKSKSEKLEYLNAAKANGLSHTQYIKEYQERIEK